MVRTGICVGGCGEATSLSVEDQRVSGVVSAGADAARGPLHRSGVSSGLNATPCHAVPRHARKMQLERFLNRAQHCGAARGGGSSGPPPASGSGGSGSCCLVGSKDAS